MASAGVSILETVGRAALRELGADMLRLSRWWMGKRDIRTRRGKIFRGTYGKIRPNPNKERKLRKFGVKEEELKPIPVPEPAPEFATPRRPDPLFEGVVWRF